jgi:hypothetical protein
VTKKDKEDNQEDNWDKARPETEKGTVARESSRTEIMTKDLTALPPILI